MKKFFTLLCVAFLATSLFANVVTGTCGDNLQWSYDTDTKALTITGSGDMWNYKRYDAVTPWRQVVGEITFVSLPDGLTSIGDYAFYDCSSLTSITIPNSVTSIGDAAFRDCSSLTSITIPNSVTSIGNHAFNNCSSLTFVTIPNSVTSIGDAAFRDCSSLTSITIPNSVTTVGGGMFYGCSKLKSVVLSNNITSLPSYDNLDLVEAYGFFENCSSLTSIAIPSSVTSIGDYAFRCCSSLTSITIPNSVTSIGSSAFYACSLTSVTIPNSVTSIGVRAFYNCSRVTMQGTTPLSISANTFGDNATIFVPCSAMDAYLAAPVWQFLNLNGLSHHVNLNATAGGSAKITAADCESNSITIEAAVRPYNCEFYPYHYKFSRWSDGNTDNPRTVTLTKDVTLTAEFEESKYYTVKIYGEMLSGSYEREEYGCSTYWSSFEGSVELTMREGTSITFSDAYVGECGNWTGWSDGVTERERTIVITSDTTIYPIIEYPQIYTVNISGDRICGYYSGYCGGSHWEEYYGTSSVQLFVNEGASITVREESSCGTWLGWSDGVSEKERTIFITSDTTIYSIIEEPKYYTVNISGNSLYGSYEYEIEGCNTSWSDFYYESSLQLTMREGTSISVREEGSCGTWLGWSDGVTEYERTIFITSDTTIYSRFDVATYSVSITAGEGGYLEYGNIEREYNECNREWIYTCAYAYDGYYFAGWSDGNTNQCIDIYPYEDINLVAQFAPKTQVTVLVGVDNASKDMGSVSGSGIYYSGDYVTISATPNTGYHFVEWSDGNGNATRELYLQSDTTLFATFAVGEYGGKCGDDLYWTYSDNTITITGSGDMDLDTYPAWNNYYDDWYYNVTAVQFPEGITSIDDYAFSEMSLTSVVVPASVTYFGENAFAYNDNLTRFEYQGTAAVCELNGNGRGMLYQSDNLVYFKGQKDMLSYMDSYAYLDTVIITSGEGFYECYWSDIRYIDNFNADDWIVEGEDYGHMYMNPVHTIILPEGLQEIGDFALHNARHLEQITIPAGVTRIGESAFEECRSLESVTFAGKALREIDDWAFYNCHTLKNITIPEGVTSIGKAAFFDCSYLKEITLPSTVQTIADNAFGQCQKVAKMTVNATTPPIVEAETFEDIDRSIPLYVPIGTSLQYETADYWCEFFNVIEYNAPSAVDNIPSSTANTRKILRNGQLLIIRDGKTYSVIGQKVE